MNWYCIWCSLGVAFHCSWEKDRKHVGVLWNISRKLYVVLYGIMAREVGQSCGLPPFTWQKNQFWVWEQFTGLLWVYRQLIPIKNGRLQSSLHNIQLLFVVSCMLPCARSGQLWLSSLKWAGSSVVQLTAFQHWVRRGALKALLI